MFVTYISYYSVLILNNGPNSLFTVSQSDGAIPFRKFLYVPFLPLYIPYELDPYKACPRLSNQ